MARLCAASNLEDRSTMWPALVLAAEVQHRKEAREAHERAVRAAKAKVAADQARAQEALARAKAAEEAAAAARAEQERLEEEERRSRSWWGSVVRWTAVGARKSFCIVLTVLLS
jgi:hypothetical protein